MSNKIRGLAIYKANGEKWTEYEHSLICVICGSRKNSAINNVNAKYIMDDGDKSYFMYDWEYPTDSLRKIEYNDFLSEFGTDTNPQSYILEDETLRKDDNNKPPVSYVEPSYIIGTARVLGFGGGKYGFNNWKNAKPEDIRRYKDALMRHMLAYFDGEIIDSDSGESHLYHMSCNLMFLDYFDKGNQ